MVHTFDAKNRVTGTANPLLVPHTCASGATLLVLSLVVKGATQRTGGTPSYNGVNMTQVNSTRVATETNCEMWYLANPSIGTYNVSIPNAGALTLYAITSSYKAQSGYTSALDVSNGLTGTTANPSIAVTTTVDGDAVVDVMGHGLNTAPTGYNQTLLYSTDTGNQSDNAQYALQGTLGVITFTWTVAADDWCIILGAFKEVVGTFPISVSGGAFGVGSLLRGKQFILAGTIVATGVVSGNKLLIILGSSGGVGSVVAQLTIKEMNVPGGVQGLGAALRDMDIIVDGAVDGSGLGLTDKPIAVLGDADGNGWVIVNKGGVYVLRRVKREDIYA